jgi:hypothetical protein
MILVLYIHLHIILHVLHNNICARCTDKDFQKLNAVNRREEIVLLRKCATVISLFRFFKV